ncbi:MAG TPA: type II toxin-antitoxin system VapC family toxin [Kiritimatiellia bacterium]|nr:type II toxin-antitoxin system VapC family toxin [Kiritimatiellia bacterium]HMO97601.1 type II toxin-antitoxin system VapC family toxin [Kiritimatiellia bacterium]HMP98038.1 type II toxin-antitoxin system VapC family toxin [Kiritimatiellia bacterium]
MNYLVDTNAWIGFFEGRRDFGKNARKMMSQTPGRCFISIAGIWEAAIKIGLGKLILPYRLNEDLPGLLAENGFQVLAIEWSDAAMMHDLERHHGDPFDRIQIMQARRRGWAVISRDPVFERYGLSRIW